MLRWILDNVGSLLLAFLMAVVVWTVAELARNPEQEKVFPQPITISLEGEPENVLLKGNIPSQAQVTVQAPKLIWEALAASQITVVADLRDLPPGGPYDVPLVASITEPDARITAVSPDHITLSLEPLISRTLPIQLTVRGEPATGYQASDPVLTPDAVEVSGPQSNVERVAEIRAQLNLQGSRASVDEVLNLTPVSAIGGRVSGVTLSPEQASVTVAVEQLGGFRDVAVRINITGTVATGYRTTDISVIPPVVTIFSSEPERVAGVPGFVGTEMIDLTDLTDDLETRVSLILPESVALVDTQTVVVRVNITAIESNLTVRRELEITGLGAGLVAEGLPETVDVILSGPLLALDALAQDDVRVILDLLGLGVGIYQVEPEPVVLPDDITPEQVLPAAIEVAIGIAPTATPGPTHTPGPSPTPGLLTATPTATPTPTPH